MKPEIYREHVILLDGKKITLETGKLAKQADGSVVVTMGNAMLLATVVSAKEVDMEVDFLPLTVDYREKFAASGRYPGGFFKREARPSTEEILVMRIVDRVLRPLFPKDYHAETQVMIQLMSHDENVIPDALAGLAASACIALSDIPFECPVSEVRIGRIDGEFIVNPTRNQLEYSDMDLMVGASEDSIMMIEGEMKEIDEQDMVEAIKIAHEEIKKQCQAQRNLVKKIGKKKQRDYQKINEDENLYNKIYDASYENCYQLAKSFKGKLKRNESFEKIKNQVTENLAQVYSKQELEEMDKMINAYFFDIQKEAVRNLILNEKIRLDGRSPQDIRCIWCEVDYLPATHGSSIFTRGETQALATVTLGTSREANQVDLPTYQGEEHFYLHYNFPPFSTGEARPLRGTSRREIGHGNLAQRSLKNMIPDDCPYTIRLVSEILESNGSSSMATVCAGTMALLDAGVKIKKTVSGIAMGLIYSEDTEQWVVLSDILGDEDHLGDMDFKVTGTRDGITACQMDIKIKGISYEMMNQALTQAKKGRLHILQKMEDVISVANSTVKPHAPKILKMEIDEGFIGGIIGPGGKNIQEMQKQTDTTIVIEEKDGKGIVEILGVNQENINKVVQQIKNITFQPQIGEIYNVKVIKLLDFGAVVEFVKGKEALLHISEIDWKRIEKIADVMKVGDRFDVKYFGIDPKTKKEKISKKALIKKY